MSQEIELYSKLQDPIQAIERLGSMMAKSGLSGAEKTETGMMLAWACLAERKSPFDIFRTYHLVEGKLAMRSDAMLAGFRQRGGKVKWKQFDAVAAIGLFSFEGSETEIGFTMEDAKRMEVIRPRSGWTKNPDAMLRARCIAKAVRMICPEVIAGYLSVEEILDDPADLPAKEIVLQSATTATVAALAEAAAPKRGRPAKTEAPPIDVVTEKVPGAPADPAPVPEKKEEPKPVPAPEVKTAGPFVAKQGADGKLDTDTVRKLFEIIGDNQKAALDWFKKKTGPWEIKNDELATLNVVKAQLIIDKSDAFLKQIGVTSAAKPA